MSRETLAAMAPTHTAQSIPPAYQELFNICAHPEEVDKYKIIRIANQMGYSSTQLDSLFNLTNTEICRTLMNFTASQFDRI